MPNYKAHKKIGMYSSALVSIILIFFLSFKIKLEPYEWILAVLVSIVYSNLPDIDHHMSRIRKYIFITIFGSLILIYPLYIFLGVSKTIAIYMCIGLAGISVFKIKHRGPTHTYPFAFLISLPLIFINVLLFIVGLTSIISHIFIDRVYSKLRKKLKKWFSFRSDPVTG